MVFHLAAHSLLTRLQKVQNSAAKLVFKARNRDHVRFPPQAPHWLPVQARIDYKLSTIGYNFSDHLTACTPSRQLRSSADTRILRVLHVRMKTFGQRFLPN